ncbi:gamma carbonic anhydrase family protein [Caenispirillum bisanense]|uniref:Carbonic anhydrase or acetyltransferase, isoleucine patch superfamily n=1 Tax=Caenispirillum bisanense TaxID=414052 RepID=A0A286GQQ4_9PROT|nr:gamma carbonic anhydrase family protein [Caenispirillum bisanense]SOD97891.1 Carbonic anhydrase or acetyltransferase, isoleucine patch superfamily [Caenispirillum bisanense]
MSPITTQQPLVLPWQGVWPKIADTAFVAPNATVIGDVEIGADSSLWFNVTVRGDVNFIRIGARSNIQDGSVIHVTRAKHETVIGDDVLVGHMAVIHGCRLESGSFVGMGATVMDAAVVEGGAMVAAGALVSPGKVVKSGQLWAGTPAKYIRDLTAEELESLPKGTAHYANMGRQYREMLAGGGA